MGRLSFSTSYGTNQYTFSDSRNKSWLSNLTANADRMPGHGFATGAIYRLDLVGVDKSIRGAAVSVDLILYDGSGNKQTFTANTTAPESSPAPLELRITIGASMLDWNNLQYIELDGPTGLVTRSGSNFFYVDYVAYTACGAPGNVALSNSISSGYKVNLSWSAGSSGEENALTGYEIGRRESMDGNTWGEMESVQTVGPDQLSLAVLPPLTFGHYYRYYVRTLGTAGAGYHSAWAACAESLQKARPELLAYTDPVITARETTIKAAHMLELQANINTMRQAYGYGNYSFSTIRAGYTSLGGWLAHVLEMRAAIDEINPVHEAWILLEENRPRAEAIMQLRRVVANL